MQKFLATLFLASLCSMVCLESCVYHDFLVYECIDTYTFVEDIRPIVETRCAISGCHNGDIGPDLNWTNFEKFQERALSGVVKFRVTNRLMPPSFSPAGPLTQEQINAIACWTDQGSLNN